MDQEQIDNRIRELESKESLTDAEMSELVSLKPGAFKKAPNFFSIGGVDVNKALQNLQALSGRAQKAFLDGYFVEAISMRLLMLDFLLRMYVVSKTGETIEADDKLSFGAIIRLAEKSGLNADIIARLDLFNAVRIKGIHRLLLGDITYDELRAAFESDPALPDDTRKIVMLSMPAV